MSAHSQVLDSSAGLAISANAFAARAAEARSNAEASQSKGSWFGRLWSSNKTEKVEYTATRVSAQRPVSVATSDYSSAENFDTTLTEAEMERRIERYEQILANDTEMSKQAAAFRGARAPSNFSLALKSIAKVAAYAALFAIVGTIAVIAITILSPLLIPATAFVVTDFTIATIFCKKTLTEKMLKRFA